MDSLRSVLAGLETEGAALGHFNVSDLVMLKAEKAQSEFQKLTTPEEARQFVQSTGVDVLAPAVGNMHGMVQSMVDGKTKKRLDIERIAQIKKATRVFLTLHGGSGTDDDDFRKAIAAGINIIHVQYRTAGRMEASFRGQPGGAA